MTTPSSRVFRLPGASLRAPPGQLESRRLRGDAEAGALDGPGDGGNVRTGRQAHLAALEIDGNRRRTGTRGGTGDGLDAAVAIHAGDLQDEFLSHVI